MELNLEMHEKM